MNPDEEIAEFAEIEKDSDEPSADTNNPWSVGAFKPTSIGNLAPEDITKIAKDIANNLIFTSCHLGQERLIGNVFMPLMLGALSNMSEEAINDIGFLYEYYDQAGKMSINGYPVFFSFRMVSKHDSKLIFEKVNKIKELLETI